MIYEVDLRKDHYTDCKELYNKYNLFITEQDLNVYWGCCICTEVKLIDLDDKSHDCYLSAVKYIPESLEYELEYSKYEE